MYGTNSRIWSEYQCLGWRPFIGPQLFFPKLRTTQTTRQIVMGALSFRIGYAKAVLVGFTECNIKCACISSDLFEYAAVKIVTK